ncbi:MAG: methyltransferase domain-containing protein [Gammaproteobacteria bacterium]|nr:methyltransferase domain-containing protein [Gammaproteobacteria bacterium]
MSANPAVFAPVTQYDAIAGSYSQSKHSPLSRYVEAWSFLGWLGDVSGLTVLDLACGDGHYSRLLASRGARCVHGIDISPQMIALARGQSLLPGLSFAVGDARCLAETGSYDLVCAAYLLHYARDVGELEAMCHGIASRLPPGGRFVALNENPEQPEERYRGYLDYGFSKSVVSPRREGAPITYAMVSGRELFRFEVYHYERRTYERALTAAGFTDIAWHAPAVDPAGIESHGAAYWREYLENPPVLGLSCRRPGG